MESGQQPFSNWSHVMRDPQLERINNRIDHLLDDLTVLKGLERSGSDVSAYIQGIALELQSLENRKRVLPNRGAAVQSQ
ncbi:MAG: hypothetical protein EBZ51_04940 [Synechococcaceae bacterium WB9_2_112]|nr:hypothetical protein [Synechococcaceae bacterium WB9_2_112]